VRGLLQPLPEDGFETGRLLTPRVDRSRRLLGYAMGARHDAELVVASLKQLGQEPAVGHLIAGSGVGELGELNMAAACQVGSRAWLSCRFASPPTTRSTARRGAQASPPRTPLRVT
jgi:hypothetical protein